jgi:hypothetical protein
MDSNARPWRGAGLAPHGRRTAISGAFAGARGVALAFLIG